MPPLDPTTILPALWRASWQAGLLCLLVLLLRFTLRDRLPAVWRCRLWGLVFLRLLLPAVPAASLGHVLPTSPVPAWEWPTVTVVVHNAISTPPAAVDDAPRPSSPAAPAAPPRWPFALLATWLAGVATLLAATLVAHVRFARRVRALAGPTPPGLLAAWHATVATRRPPRLVMTSAVTSPAVFGFARGQLLLPPDLAARLPPDQLALVLQHEAAHVRRRDLPIGWAMVLIRCVYWFHPLVWVAVAARRVDAESACDDRVTATGDRMSYARTLLAVAGGPRVPALGMADARTDLRRRLARIAAGHRPGRWSAVVAALLTAAVGCATLSGSERSANVTRTYPRFWPESYPREPSTSTTGLTVTQTAWPNQVSVVPEMIHKSITPGAWGHHGIDVHDSPDGVMVTAPPETQAQVERLLAEKMINVSIETHVLNLRPSAVRAAGLALPDAGRAELLSDPDRAVLFAAAGESRTLNDGPPANDQRDAYSFRADPNAVHQKPPRLTNFNGQSSLLVIETRQSYVSGITPVVHPSGVAFNPTVDTLVNPGLCIQAKGTVTPDHQSVDLETRTQFARLVSMTPVEMTATTAGSTTRASYQVPLVHVVTLNANLRVPSGGAVWARGNPIETTYGTTAPQSVPDAGQALARSAGRPATQPADPDAPEIFVVWTVKVLPPRPATRPAAAVASRQ